MAHVMNLDADTRKPKMRAESYLQNHWQGSSTNFTRNRQAGWGWIGCSNRWKADSTIAIVLVISIIFCVQIWHIW